jgi:hypothetical protein
MKYRESPGALSEDKNIPLLLPDYLIKSRHISVNLFS